MFRPLFETLERRDVFSATGAGLSSDSVPASDNGPGTHLQPVAQVLAAPGHAKLVRVAAGDVNGDGRADLLAVSDGTSNTILFYILPYIEQENVYRIDRSFANATPDDEPFFVPMQWDDARLRAAAHDAVFAELGDRLPPGAEPNQIIAILIGLRAPERRSDLTIR